VKRHSASPAAVAVRSTRHFRDEKEIVLRAIAPAFAATVLLTTSMHATAAEPVTVFLLDAKYQPVVRLEKLTPSLGEPLRAILAMYTFQAGGGCEKDTEAGLKCDLNDALRIGPQCSAAQLKLIRDWFKDIPRMSGYAEDNYRNVQRPEALETICYSSPIIASFQDKWEKIRVQQNGARITVDAVGHYLAHEHSGQFRYRTSYKIEGHSIKIVTHQTFPTKPDKNKAEDEDDAAE
jgi:hypothetical protein